MKKKYVFTAALTLLVTFMSCNQMGGDKKSGASSENVTEVKVRFDYLALGTGGAWFIFVDEQGNTLTLFDNGETDDLIKHFREVMPNSPDHQFQNNWYKVKYAEMDVEVRVSGGENYFDKRKVVLGVTKL